MIVLHDHELSSGCYKVRLLAGFLGLPLRRVNTRADIPVMEDEGLVLREVAAILVYLAGRYDTSRLWYALNSPGALEAVDQWLGFATRLSTSVGRARRRDALFAPADIEVCRTEAHASLRLMDEHLWFAEQEGHEWLCTPTHPTIADVACFPDVMLSEEGGVSRLAYPSVRRWTDRVKRLPKFQVMPGIFP